MTDPDVAPWRTGATEDDRWDGYLIPDTDTLRNFVGAETPFQLRVAEDRLTRWRLVELQANPIAGKYDLHHLQAIHGHLFQDVYPWAGELRTIDMAKEGTPFAPHTVLKPLLADVLDKAPIDHLRSGQANRTEFVTEATTLYLSINLAHPFREGNGRTQRAFLSQLASESGYRMDWTKVDAATNNRASKLAVEGDPMPLLDLVNGITERVERPDPHQQPAAPSRELQEAQDVLRLARAGMVTPDAAVDGRPPRMVQADTHERTAAYRARAERSAGGGVER